ncbi:MAG: hypothetical protein KA059_05270 [Elusimicrobiales bacterium]|jgi:hypothetical protein|nr:hypothetical protein [Elusimicrobiales bacterium]NLH38899.1 hypothetical protein [Elusimicrobiota bacterium]
MIKIFLKRFSLISAYSIAMAFLEAAVVIYLRKLFYPSGFYFPVKNMPSDILVVELLREASTIVMLITVAMMASKKNKERFSYFIYSFGVWDIFYYIWLYLMIGWPESLLTYDILFLIPVIWVGPVLAPVIVSLTMIVSAITYILFIEKGYDIDIKRSSLILACTGSFIIFLSFIIDLKHIISVNTPIGYRWWVFNLGEFLIIAGYFITFKNYFIKRKS